MYLLENPVLQREMLVNLRMARAFLLLFFYVGMLGLVVYAAWPQPEAQRIDLSNPEASRRLVDLFFLGQYLLASLMAPSFAAAALTGEKERKTYEMLLASPLAPAAVLVGKLLGALAHVVLLVVASLPIVVLCLPLGGVSFYEVLGAYVALVCSIITFGMISLAASSYFSRTVAALAVSYLAILPLALAGIALWWSMGGRMASLRLVGVLTVVPIVSLVAWLVLGRRIIARLLHPPDVGSEGKEVVDEEDELREAVGLVIRRGHFPDSLFAPAKRNDLLEDRANPVLDKELRSEIFSQGTLMLRVVIQVSMFLSLPLMGCWLYVWPQWAPWYVSYVLVFNMLVGPVFSAGTVTSERERQTLDLLLTTILSPWQILWAKLISGMRVSSVLTSFLTWPMVLACLMVSQFWSNLGTVFCYGVVIAVACVTTATIPLFCSVCFRKTSVSLMTSYLVLILLFAAPVAALFFAQTFFERATISEILAPIAQLSPFSAVFALPLDFSLGAEARPANWPVFFGFLACYATINVLLVASLNWLFYRRWRVAQ